MRTAGLVCMVVPAFALATPTESVQLPALLAQIQPLDRFEAEQERLRQAMSSQPPAYVDRVMEESPEAGEAAPASSPEVPVMGLRSWLVESRLGWNGQTQSGQNVRRDAEGGVRLEHRFETLNHGEWVLQADTRRQGDSGVGSPSSSFLPTEEKRGNRLTLRNQGFPVTPFVFADSAVGDISSEVTDGLSRGLRLSLGSSTVRGASVRLFAREFDVRIGLGQRGQLAGGPYPGFERAQGDLTWAGYTHRWGAVNYAAVQASHASQLPWSGAIGDPVMSDAQTSSWAATVGHGYSLNNDGDRRVRLTVLKSETSPTTGERSPSQGIYLEGGLRVGRFRHEGGLYSTEPRLRFGDQWVADGARGVFWRLDQSDNRLNWGLGPTTSASLPATPRAATSHARASTPTGSTGSTATAAGEATSSTAGSEAPPWRVPPADSAAATAACLIRNAGATGATAACA